MTEYFVVHKQHENLSGITIEKAGKTYDHPIETWAIRSGKQVLAARQRLGKQLDAYHVGGSFDRMACYALSYEELCALVTEQMGPSDRVVYNELVKPQVLGTPEERQRVAAEAASLTIETVIKAFFGGLKFLAIMVIVPFVLMFFGKRR